MTDLRDLRFDNLDEAVSEVVSLLHSGYLPQGNWTLAQICRHLRLVQDPSIDGYPKWMSLMAFLRPLMRRLLLPRLMSGDSPIGVRTAGNFVPPGNLDDAVEAERFSASVARFKSFEGDFAPHPAFGRMKRGDLEKLHSTHAAHHLRFLQPKTSAATDDAS